MTDYLGLAAAGLSIIAASGGILIQIVKVAKLKAADQFSLVWMILGVITWFSWTVYGLESGDMYVLVANFLGFVLQMVLLGFILKYRKNKKRNGTRKIQRQLNKTEVQHV